MIMLRRITLAALVGFLMVGLTTLAPVAGVARAETDSKAGADAAAPLDKIIFKNGTVMECRIVEETPTTVTVKYFFKGIEAGEGTYEKSEIIDIQRGKGGEEATDSRKKGMIEKENPDDAKEEVDPDAVRVYLMEFEGTFGSDISETPLTEAFEDADEMFADLTNGVIDGQPAQVVDPAVRDQHIVVIKMDCHSDPRMGFDGIWRFKGDSHGMDDILEHEFKKGRRIVFWVKEALDGAAIVPWIGPEVYFHPEGLMFFTSDLNEFDIGDDMVDEKQISLRIAQAEGYANKGGYTNLAGTVIKAMARSKYWLAYRLVGGEPEFMMKEPTEEDIKAGWILLSDDGSGDHEDKNPMRVQNDRLVMTADLAKKLGFSKGDAKTMEDLAFDLNIHRNYVVVEGKAERIFDKWHDDKEAAFERINQKNGSLWIELQRISVGGDYAERKRARGRQIRVLQEIYSDFSRFAEVWDPQDQFRSQIRTRIEQIKKDQQADKAAQRG